MINNVVLAGRLVKPVEVLYTPKGTAYGRFTLAVNRRFAGQDGQREADFISCVIWQKSAEALAKYTTKGTAIGVEGRLQTRSYTNKEGKKVYTMEVICENFSFLESKNKGNAVPSVTEADAVAAFGDVMAISDESLPF